ncbi:MAG: arylsulfatase [Oleispira sp.]|nr:arylsulfatase [Oleispira sp.]MBL4880347.1 arylsulfatase [Oleispira sp.]
MKNLGKLLASIVFVAVSSFCFAESKPNIVYILVDNWGWADLSVQGGTIQTPNIDRLANEGLRLTNFNVQNQCTPTRSALHTGRLPIRSGTYKVPAPGEPDGLAAWEYTLPELLSDAGYATALFGKWHLGMSINKLPNTQGYDQFWGHREGTNAASYTSTAQFDPLVATTPHIWEGVKGKDATKVKPFDLQARATMDREITEKSIAYIKKMAKSGKPFYNYIALTHFHPPFLVHPDFKNKSKAGVFADTVMEVDFNIGEILKAIKDAGIADNTLVILTGDNAAGAFPVGGVASGEVGGSNGPWRGGLSTAYEGGMRTPAMMRWPGNIPKGKVSDEIFADLDWYSTIAEIAGAKSRIPTDRPMDSMSQVDFLLGKQDKSNREHVVTFVGTDVWAVKWRNMKIHFKTAEGTHDKVATYTFPQVYDIKNDPSENFELWANEGYAHAWIMEPISKILAKLQASMVKYPNIKPGEEFAGYK